MKTYRFLGERTHIEYFTIDIEAESLEEAQEILKEGEYDEYRHYQESVDGSEKIEFQAIAKTGREEV
jgi:hypothetical protein